MIKTYSIYKPFWTKRIKTLFFLLLIIICLITLIIIFNVKGYWFIPVVIGLFSAYLFDKISNQKETASPFFQSTIEFNNDTITIDKTAYQLNSVQNLVFELNDWDDKPCYASRRITYLSGIDNYFQFNFNGEKLYYQFYIDSELQFEEILLLFKHWYNKGFELIEKSSNGETLLFNKEATYLEIAELKKRK